MKWTASRARDYVAASGMLGTSQLISEEVSDGNLNFVFRVQREGDGKSLILKQAPPYIKVLGPDYPLTTERLAVEARAMRLYHELAPGSVPEPLRYDGDEHVLVMEDLQGFTILRRALMEGTIDPGAAAAVGTFMGATHRATLRGERSAKELSRYRNELHNPDMRAITADYVFTKPFREDPTNRHTEGLDAIVAEVRADGPLQASIRDLRDRFLGEGDGAVHGDLHTGSVMVRGSEARVIDGEFAFYGPIAFDPGALIANYLLAWHAQPVSNRGALLACVHACWDAYRRRFGPSTRLDEIWDEAIRFAGVKMMRRILGAAHVEDIESIENVDDRRAVETRAIASARRLVTDAPDAASLESVLAV